jgi:putative PIN family toxin of toxin-antitoxin system
LQTRTSLPPPAGAVSTSQPLRLVLDTNVVMALWHFRDPRLLRLREYINAGSAVLLTRGECLDELRRVLQYVQFKLDGSAQTKIFDDYVRQAECVSDASEAETEAAKALPQCKDRDDQKFLQLAWDAQAHVLVTRDKLLLGLARRPMLRERMAIVTPERLVQTHLTPDSAVGPDSS